MRRVNPKLGKKVALLKRMGMFAEEDTRVLVRRAITGPDLERAYELVHRVFVEKGYIYPELRGIRIRPFEALPEMATFVAECDSQVVGVMSIVPDSPDFGMPSDHAFGPELDTLRLQNRRVCEISNLAVDTAYWRSNVFPELTRACFAQALAWGCDNMFIAISPGHAQFFEEVLQFSHVGDARDYAAGKGDIVEGKCMDLGTIEQRAMAIDRQLGGQAFLHRHYFTNNPYHACVGPWAKIARQAFLEPDTLRALFIERSGLLEHCSPEQRDGLCRRWGALLFEAVYQETSAALAYA